MSSEPQAILQEALQRRAAEVEELQAELRSARVAAAADRDAALATARALADEQRRADTAEAEVERERLLSRINEQTATRLEREVARARALLEVVERGGVVDKSMVRAFLACAPAQAAEPDQFVEYAASAMHDYSQAYQRAETAESTLAAVRGAMARWGNSNRDDGAARFCLDRIRDLLRPGQGREQKAKEA